QRGLGVFVDAGAAQLLVELFDADASRLFLELQVRDLGPDRFLLMLGAQPGFLARAQLLGQIIEALARQAKRLLAAGPRLEGRLQGLLRRLRRKAREALAQARGFFPAALGRLPSPCDGLLEALD